MIKVGDNLPSIASKIFKDGPADINLAEAVSNQTVVIIAVPGAFTGVCTKKHVPAFQNEMAALKEAGADAIYCLSVNDPFVMGAWQSHMAVNDVTMVADWNAEFTKAMGTDLDIAAAGLGVRSHRYMMVVQNGVVKSMHLEDNPGAFDVSTPANAIADLKSL